MVFWSEKEDFYEVVLKISTYDIVFLCGFNNVFARAEGKVFTPLI